VVMKVYWLDVSSCQDTNLDLLAHEVRIFFSAFTWMIEEISYL